MSARIAARYQCWLPEDLADWFDSRVWQKSGGGEYCDPVDPHSLLEAAPEVIWPGLMPCDFLPVLGSRAGDWLGVRMDSQNHASEIIQWYHGGGDWIPWGHTLSEAILYGAVCHRLPGPKRRHAIPADDFPNAPATADDPLLNWATDHIAIDRQLLSDPNITGVELADCLLEQNIGEAAVRCDLVQSALAQPLTQTLDRRLAQSLGIDWSDALRWSFDSHGIPSQTRKNLRDALGGELNCAHDKEQDWILAQQHAQQVTQRFPDLAWGWDLLGYCLEKSARWSDAQQAYVHGIGKTVFTDQSVKLRTHWTADAAAKFSAARLIALSDEQGLEIPVAVDQQYLRAISEGDTQRRRVVVQDYWLDQANQCDSDAAKLDALVAAGWDLGAEPIKALGEILHRISVADGSQSARSTLAATHSECFRQRYGI